MGSRGGVAPFSVQNAFRSLFATIFLLRISCFPNRVGIKKSSISDPQRPSKSSISMQKVVFGFSWRPLGPFGGASWRPIGCPWGHHKTILAHRGSILARLGATLGLPSATGCPVGLTLYHLGPTWSLWQGILGPMGTFLGPFGVILALCWSHVGDTLGSNWGIIEDILGTISGAYFVMLG